MGRGPFAMLVAGGLACSVPAHTPAPSSEAPLWPSTAPVASFVANMPASEETSIESVALAIPAKEPDPVLRLRALHDWVATRLRYDRAREAAPPQAAPLAHFWEASAHTPVTGFSMQTFGPYPPAADRVFEARVGVCGDYASLLSELGKYAGLDVKYVTGYARSWGPEDEGYHSWNVGHVGDRWLMIDATWDSQPYSTDYLFVPPDVFAQSHFPDRKEDLHTTKDVSRSTFDARPLTSPRFFAERLEFVGDVGNPMFVKGNARLSIANPERVDLRAVAFATRQSSQSGYWSCTLKGAETTVVECEMPTSGDYQVAILPGGQSFQSPLAVVHVIEE